MATGATTSMRSRVTALSLRAFTRLALVRALLALALSFVTSANADDRRAAHEVPLVDLSSIEDGTIFPRGTRWAVYPNVLVDETPMSASRIVVARVWGSNTVVRVFVGKRPVASVPAVNR